MNALQVHSICHKESILTKTMFSSLLGKHSIHPEYIGEGLESDPTRGVRIKLDAFHAVKGVPRSSEYESVLEQDPFGDTHETGGNDDVFGEWGLDKDAPFLSTLEAAGMLAVGMSSIYVFYRVAIANVPKQVAVLPPPLPFFLFCPYSRSFALGYACLHLVYVFVNVYLSIYIYVIYTYICININISIYLSIYLSVYLSIYLSIYIYIYI